MSSHGPCGHRRSPVPSGRVLIAGRPIDPLIGVSLVPEAASWPGLLEAARAADEAGLDLIGIQDHPYQWRFLDTFSLIAALLARTERIRLFPDVANLPLRPPAMLGKTAASLDALSGGRFELGLGAGGFWDAVEAMGGPRRTPGEAVEALKEAIEILRLMWSGERAVRFDGKHYRVRGVHPGKRPPHRIEIWVGAYRPRMLRLIGERADGWIPSLGRISQDDLRRGQSIIDEAARAAGRDPKDIRRLLNIGATITAPGAGDTKEPAGRAGSLSSGLAGPPAFWRQVLGGLRELGFTAFVFWLPDDPPDQIERLASDVAPALRG